MEAFALSADAPRVPLPHRLLSDDRLLRLIAAGNAQAFGTVYARYHAPLYAYCRSIVRDADDARDALQNTMMKALAALNRGGDREIALKPWLFRIAHNESISLLRKRRPEEELTDAVSPPVAGVHDAVVDRERLKQLIVDLQELPERQRGALLMREVTGLSYEQIAGALGISPGAARQTVFEARTALAEYGQGREVACENIRRSISDGDGRALRARRVRAHLRSCNGCRDFQSTLTTRRRDLAMLTPALSGGGALALLQAVVGTGAVAGGGAVATGGAGLLGGSASVLLGGAATKTVVAVVAATATGVGAVEIADKQRPQRDAAPRAVPAQVAQASAAQGDAGVSSAVTSSDASTQDAAATRAAGSRGSDNGPNGFALLGAEGERDEDRGSGGGFSEEPWDEGRGAPGAGHEPGFAREPRPHRRPGPDWAGEEEPWDDAGYPEDEEHWDDPEGDWREEPEDAEWEAAHEPPPPPPGPRPGRFRPKPPPPPAHYAPPEPVHEDEPVYEEPAEDLPEEEHWEDVPEPPPPPPDDVVWSDAE